jgi:hypothetical protein
VSFGLLIPAGLLALVGLLLPLLIHLIRRSELVVTDFAALRWLSARARPRRRLRFDELALLAVRLGLIAVIALLLAQAVLTGWPAARGWLLVVPGVDPSTVPGPDGASPGERRWLAPGFPALDSPMPAAGASSSLLRELDADLAPGSAMTVIVPAELDGLDGERPRLSRPVEWQVSSSGSSRGQSAAAAPLGLWLAHDPARIAELRFVRAAADAGSPALEIRGEIALPGTFDGFDWPAFAASRLIWLSDQALPPAVMSWVADGGQVLRVGVGGDAVVGDPVTIWRGAAAEREVRAYTLGGGRVMVLSARLVPERLPELLAPDFPQLLRGWLESPGQEPARAAAESHAPGIGPAVGSPAPRRLDDWLALLIAALFLIERWLASAPGRLR